MRGMLEGSTLLKSVDFDVENRRPNVRGMHTSYPTSGPPAPSTQNENVEIPPSSHITGP